MAKLLESFQTIAKTNETLMAELKAERAKTNSVSGDSSVGNQRTDMPGAVAITGIKVPLEMGNNAEERLVSFHA